MIDRGEEYWAIPRLWAGGTAFVLGGGPSLNDEIAAAIRRRHVIAINSGYRLTPWAEILFFTDFPWWVAHEAAVRAWPLLAVTTNKNAKRAAPDKLLRVRTEEGKLFPALGSGTMRAGGSSGHLAVSLAIALGAARVVLLGFDMRHVHGRSHHHDDYRNEDPHLYARQFAPAFDGWRYAAQQRGVEILNATPGSALKEFPMADLAELLSR